MLFKRTPLSAQRAAARLFLGLVLCSALRPAFISDKKKCYGSERLTSPLLHMGYRYPKAQKK